MSEPAAGQSRPVHRVALRLLRKAALFKRLGPGLITGAADDDPSGIATYSQAGAGFGLDMLWTTIVTFPLMTAVQSISARIGRVTGKGLAANMRGVLPPWLITALVAALFIANTVNVAADLSAMGEAAKMIFGGSQRLFTIALAVLSLTLQVIAPYHRYVRWLKWLTMALLAYVGVVLTLKIDWGQVALHTLMPQLPFSLAAVTTVVALFGTTISPYLFFWQSAEEVEDLEADADAQPLTLAPAQADSELRRIRWDTLVGMGVSNVIAFCVILSAAATLHGHSGVVVDTAAQAAEALRPVAGPLAFLLFGVGIIGAGLLAVPVLAGSAAYAVGESRGWVSGLEHKPWEAVGFYSVIGASMLIALVIGEIGVDPFRMLFWSAVVNGLISPPIMAAMMVIASRRDRLGQFVASPLQLWFGWSATAVMFAASGLMLVMELIDGLKG